MKILALGSHIDDIEIGLGGSLLKHRDAGDEIVMAITHSDDALAGDVITRKVEQKKSAEMLNASRFILFDGKDPIEEKIGRLDEIAPNILYFPFELDYHQAHQETARIGFAVARRVQITVLRYLAPTSHSYYPNWLNVIDIKAKKRLVNIFKSQMKRRPKFMEVMVAQSRYFGSLITGNGHYAEGFVLHRTVQL